MFFIMGISSREEEIDFSQTIICPGCGSYGRLEAFMTYEYFSLFFIRIFKWNKKFYMRSICCGSLYIIDNKLGKEIETGQRNKIDEADLKDINIKNNRERFCRNCNYSIESEFDYCPKCGIKI